MSEVQLGKYDVRGTLGKGAMGTVYDGWDPVIDRRVAIKTVRLPEAHDEEAEEGLARFKREAQAAGRLHHPNIVGVYDYGETAEVAFIVMEFVDGLTLKGLLDAEERLPVAQTVRIMQDILAGLAYSHERGVVHRDIKPANIMLTKDNRAKIADFGIARIESSSMTQAGTVLGTPAYMSPEQFMGQTVDRRTDFYSTGVLLYQLLTGERPFEGSLTAIMHKALNTVPPRPSELSVTAPVGLDAVVSRAMARRPEDRFESADAFAQALTQAMQPDPVAATESDATIISTHRSVAPALPPLRPTAPAPAPAARSGSKLPLVLAGVVALLVIAGGGGWVLLSGKPEPAVVVATTRSVPSPAAPIVAQTQPPISQPSPPPSALPATTATTVPPAVTQAPPVPITPPSPPPVATIAPPPPSPAPVTPPAAPPPSVASLEPPPLPKSVTPVVPPRPVRSAASVDSALAASLPGLACTLAQSTVSPDAAATIAGLAGRGAPESALRQAVTAANPIAINWNVANFDGPYCPALDLLRPAIDVAARTGAGLAMTEADGRTSLRDGQIISVDLTMPNFGGYLYVAYLQHDGTAASLVPGPGYPARSYSAGAKTNFGHPAGNFPGWQVGPPFGTDMIIAIASTGQLFTTALPESEPIGSYLRRLQTAMDDLRRRGGSLAANAILLETLPAH